MLLNIGLTRERRGLTRGDGVGNELKCRVRFGKKKSDGKALLETSEIIFRGDFRLKIPFAEIQSATAVDGELELRTADGVAVFELGEDIAAKWREKILHPKTRMEKLGIKSGAKIVTLGFSKEDLEFLEELTERTKDVSEGAVKADTQWIFLKVEAKKELQQLSKIVKSMRGAAAMWVVYPKGRQEITEGDVLSAGRGGGLKDVKVVGFSGTHTALKFVIPVSAR
jgi:hypothetical protein